MTRFTRPLALLALVTLSAGLPLAGGGCSGYRDSGGEADPGNYLSNQSSATVTVFKTTDPTINKFFDNAHAYAVFPSIAKGGLGIGAANGEGVVYEKGMIVGYASVTQVTIGAQIGGQSFRQIVFFQDAATFEGFKRGQTEFAANASAVAAKSGAAASNDYANGVAVFVIPTAGLMAEASIGGQKFKFRPVGR